MVPIGELTYPVTEWDDEAGDFVVVGREKSPCAHIAKVERRYYSGEYAIVQDRPVIATDGDWVVWRLADLILLRAECRANLGLTTAVDDLDRVRAVRN